jgi:wobble nucleotide-excising tRNase
MEVNTRHSRDVPGRFERALRICTERLQFWSRFCEVPSIRLETERMMRDWQASRDGVVAALEAKRNAPLDRTELPIAARDSIDRFAAHRADVETLNRELQRTNERISVVKGNAAAGDAATVRVRLDQLTATKLRRSPEVETLCAEYTAAQRAKRVTEEVRDNAQERLEQYRASAFPRYQQAINYYLNLFGAGFRIQGVAAVDNRGGPTCNYSLVINSLAVPIDGGIIEPGEPAFKNTLSSGDRNALALAFFLSSVDPDPQAPNPNLAQKVIVVDDPVSSFDEHRTFATVQELRRLGTRAAQLVILSHSKDFLCKVWRGIDQAQGTAIKIERHADGSSIVPWDINNDSLTEHDRNHCLLRSYLLNGPGPDSRRVATALRPTVEGFLRVARPEDFPPAPRILHRFIRDCRSRQGTLAEILNARDTRELGEIVEYADLFHHETNSAWETVVINDGELQLFVRRVLDFATR